jgi:imidazolonepropionase-like amidohydrolase
MLVVAALAAAQTASEAQAKERAGDRAVAITDAVIFDATGREPFRGNVIIRGDRITAVGPRARVPRGAVVIKADGKALLPGFFDVHTHWSPNGSPAPLPQIASAYVMSGVTTVNDFHQQPEAFEPRRAWLGTLVAPHVFHVARMSTPGGHGADWGDINTTKWVATADSARREVIALQPYRPDFIKAFADGWRYGTLPEETSMNLETLQAVVDEAHRHGQKVLTHTVTVDRGRLAAQARADVIAHSLQDKEIDAESVALIKAAGTAYAPTLAIYEPGDAAAARMDDPVVRQRLRKWGFAQHNLRMLHAAGVPIVLGTDAGIGGAKHGTASLREMELLVGAGLPAREALLAGTSRSAMALGLSQDRGTIEVGKRADLVVIDGKPWDNISDVRRIDRVLIDGRLVKGPGIDLPPGNFAASLPPSPAAELIDDFERADGRSLLDTLRLTDIDGGVERSVVVANIVPRTPEGRALSIAARMAPKDQAEGGVLVPLRRGSVQPVDARSFSGISAELRGAGHYQIVVATLAGEWTATVEGKPEWSEVRVPFAALKPIRQGRDQPRVWRGDDLLQVGLVARRDASASAWVEIDNLRFYAATPAH